MLLLLENPVRVPLRLPVYKKTGKSCIHFACFSSFFNLFQYRRDTTNGRPYI